MICDGENREIAVLNVPHLVPRRAELGARVDGKTVLVLYYLDRRGTHEELAEVLHVSRATYFRNHRQALERLAHAVFA
ncbi:sigma factor-like helix-turn-helix DNA-binding protein [Sulfobacillus harzensis]|uniref:sigma factor-like helix-turn-helix DNA-binding protein n=1 Tax=Sulfobacillus harzensis TaxID=2729629 RepID=UPI00145C9571|nr:sigma factor-like helix-turn-helix DNA-binding protein [Sulfobacillus harzensis]